MKIKCEFNNVTSSCSIGMRYTCIVRSVVITERNTRITAIAGKHLAGKTNKDVERIWFEQTKVEYFPRGLDKFLPNLHSVMIRGCGLKELNKRDLIGLEGLIELFIPSNLIETLSPNLLKNMKNLTHVSFDSNELKFVDSKMFDHIKDQLVQLNFNNNPSISALYYIKDTTTGTIDDLLKTIDKKFPNAIVGHNFHEDFCENFKHLWSSGRFSDFIVFADNKDFKVHKNVLGIQSPVFAAMFENDMEENKSGKVTINDFSADAVEEFLRFLYTGEIPDETNAMEIFALAFKYDVKALTLEMEETIAMNIDRKNMNEILRLGNLYNSEFLITEAFAEIQLAYPGLKFPDHMINKPENIEKLIEAKQKHDQVIAESYKRFKEIEEYLLAV